MLSSHGARRSGVLWHSCLSRLRHMSASLQFIASPLWEAHSGDWRDRSRALIMRNTAKKILIVDENNIWRISLGIFIKSLGYEVFETTTGAEAVHKACSLRPDLIMMGLRLPG